jgi:hypothetical protein
MGEARNRELAGNTTPRGDKYRNRQASQKAKYLVLGKRLDKRTGMVTGSNRLQTK